MKKTEEIKERYENLDQEKRLNLWMIGVSFISLLLPPTLSLVLIGGYMTALMVKYPELLDRIKSLETVRIRPFEKWLIPIILTCVALFIFFHPMIKVALMAMIIQFILIQDILRGPEELIIIESEVGDE